jgi:hypothetical protein
MMKGQAMFVVNHHSTQTGGTRNTGRGKDMATSLSSLALYPTNAVSCWEVIRLQETQGLELKKKRKRSWYKHNATQPLLPVRHSARRRAQGAQGNQAGRKAGINWL